MICSNCHAQIPDGSTSCIYCGARLNPDPSAQQGPAGSWSGPQGYQPNGQAGYQQNGQPGYQQNYPPAYPPNGMPGQGYYQTPPAYSTPTPALPMNWFQFLIMFSLWANAAIQVLTGIMYLTGFQYELEQDGGASLVYAIFPVMKTLDIVFGLLFLGLAALAVVSRFMLAKYKKNGPVGLYILLVLQALLPILYGIIVTAATGINVMSADMISQIVLSVVWLVCNSIYFNKRRHMFVN